MSRIRSGYFTTDCGFGICKPPYYFVEVCKNCVYRFFKLRLWGALQLEIMPPKRTKSTQMLAVICPACEKRIVDASANTTGEDSISVRVCVMLGCIENAPVCLKQPLKPPS